MIVKLIIPSRLSMDDDDRLSYAPYVHTILSCIYEYIPVYTCICVYLRVYTTTSTTKNTKNNGSRKGNDLTCSLGMCQNTARVALHTQNKPEP